MVNLEQKMTIRFLCIALLCLEFGCNPVAAAHNSSDIGVISLRTWMGDIQERILDERLSDLIIPGTHASSAYTLSDGTRYAEHSGRQDTAWASYSQPRTVPGWPWLDLALALGMYSLAERWLLVHTGDFSAQLNAGYRYFDLQITNCGGKFCWSHGLIGDPIKQGLQQFNRFAVGNMDEILILGVRFIPQSYENCKAAYEPGDLQKQLMSELHKTFRDSLIPFSPHTIPKVSDIIRMKKNVIISCSDRYGCNVPANISQWIWNSRTNETLREHQIKVFTNGKLLAFASTSLRSYRQTNDLSRLKLVVNTPTYVLVCSTIITSTVRVVVLFVMVSILWVMIFFLYKALRRKRLHHLFRINRTHNYGILGVIVISVIVGKYLLSTISPCFIGQDIPSSVSDFGDFVNFYGDSVLVSKSTKHCDKCIHNQGVNDFLEHWFSRSKVYKPNILLVNSFASSRLPELALRFNAGFISKSISLTYIGTPLKGKTGVRTWFSCQAVTVSYLLASRDEGQVLIWNSIPIGDQVPLSQYIHPMDTYIIIFAGNLDDYWYQLYTSNLHSLIELGEDIYIRGSLTRTGRGLAYLMTSPDDGTNTCYPQVPAAVLNFTKWDLNTIPQSKKKKVPTATLR